MLITHVLAELYDCGGMIEDPVALATAAKAAARSAGATVVGEYEVRYVPHGLTVAVFLAESHIVLTTWPEYRLTLLDVLLCNATMDYELVVASIKDEICPDGQIVTHAVPRNVAKSP
jgi:S-adenosylmethionine decarboxylase